MLCAWGAVDTPDLDLEEGGANGAAEPLPGYRPLDLEGRADGAAERVLAMDQALVAEDEALRARVAEAGATGVLAPW